MGRKKKFETEDLIGFIKQYLAEQKSLELLMPTKVANYCQNALHIPILYQSFTRNLVVKNWIDEYNANLHQRLTNEGTEPSVLPETSIDVDDAMYRYRDPEDMKQFLMGINRQMGKLTTACHQYSKQYRECSEKMACVEEQNAILTDQLASLNQKLSDAQAQFKILQDQNVLYKKKLRAIGEYLNNYLYEPILLNHLQDLGLLSAEKSVDVPSCAENLSTETMDFTESVTKFYAITDPDVQDSLIEEKPILQENNFVEDKTVNNDVISAKMAALAEKFSKL